MNSAPPPSRWERILATMIAGIVGLSVLAFFAIIIGTWTGMENDDFSSGVWPTLTLLPLFGLPLGFVLIIALLVVSTRRRRAGEAPGERE
ncbi:MAG: multidrug ABC transporter ATPase [Pontimonas sp.]|nr:multidrug ABC transporter ATPase [Pontimonas sp.]MDR9397058.1 multidrug ABC transporter ATPase [Pontimonas sp.]MDR9434993.1 multidrug ABC transporter ATPase [Pontimonas sp.]